MTNTTFHEPQNNRLGIALMCLTMLIFAFQDMLSKHLAGTYNVYMVTAIRYWVLALLGVYLAARHADGFRAAIRSAAPTWQILRGVLLVTQICVMVSAFVLLGLIEAHAIFASTPLVVAALSGPLLGERVGWRRWTAIGIGFIGMLIILRPGFGVFSPYALVAVAGAMMFAVYTLLTRHVAHVDGPETSFFWMGAVGLVIITPIGLWHWEAMTWPDAGMMAMLCCTSAGGHFLLTKVYAIAEASLIQPFTYLQLAFASLLAVMILGEVMQVHTAIGSAVVVGAGIYALLRERSRKKAA
ncbi:MAG: DMT family transporter [Pseudomonadota bacterium]